MPVVNCQTGETREHTAAELAAMAPTLSDLKARKKAAVKGHMDALFDIGFAYDFGGSVGVRRLDLRTADDKLNWKLTLDKASGYVAAGAGAATTYIRDAANNPRFQVTYTVAKAATEAMLTWGEGVLNRKWVLDEAIDGAADAAAVAAINEAAGWPA